MFVGSHNFLKNFLRDPQAVGAVAPATHALARNVALATHEVYRRHVRSVERWTPLRLIELGAGTGALTHRISRLNPVLVERDETWAAALRQQFPTLEVRHECATRTLKDIDQPVGVVTSIPLLNNPLSKELKSLLAVKYAAGFVKFCVLYTYSWTNPLPNSGFLECRRARFVARNLPPAYVWVYQ